MVVCAVGRGGLVSRSRGQIQQIQVLRSDFGGGGGLAVVTLVQPLGGFEFGEGGRRGLVLRSQGMEVQRGSDIPIVKVEKD